MSRNTVQWTRYVNKPLELAEFWKGPDFDSFFDVFFKMSTVNLIPTIYRQLTHQSSLDRHPYWVFYDKVEIAIFWPIVDFEGDLRLTSSLKLQFLTFDPHNTP